VTKNRHFLNTDPMMAGKRSEVLALVMMVAEDWSRCDGLALAGLECARERSWASGVPSVA
jgi:hypothetical protein